MELIQLHYFIEVARWESFSRAAETLHITQSALSKSIARLEEEVGVQLFERQGNRIRINQMGNVLLNCFNQTVTTLENGLAQTRDIAGRESGNIRIGISGDVFIKPLVKKFLLTHPNVSMTCLLLSKEQMASSLEEGTMDFTISTEPVEGVDLYWQPVYEDHLTVLLSPQHPFSAREALFLEELADEKFIITNMGYGMKSSTYSLCRQAGFEPKVLYEGYDNELAGALVNQGLGVMVTPHSIAISVSRSIPKPAGAPVIKIPLLDKFTNKSIGICAKRGHYQSAAALEFHAMVTEHFKNLV